MTKTVLLTVFACGFISSGFVYGAPRPETSTYVDGNVTSLKPNTGGTLVFTDEKSMMFRTGISEVAVPYASILRAELGATQTHNHNSGLPGPLKVLSMLSKTETQLLTLEFKIGAGEPQTMTLELAKPAASSVLATIEQKTDRSADKLAPKSAVAANAKDDWWGDSIWKTNRNLPTWSASSQASK